MERLKNGDIRFKDYPEFRPNLTPEEIFSLGSFGGTYWRPIYSAVTGKNYKNKHKKYRWGNIDDDFMTSSKYDKTKNYYGVQVGSTLEDWERQNWINPKHPYGWVQWYCEFYAGRRHWDDERQIKRWVNIAGNSGRFRQMLINQIISANTKYSNFEISPKIRQTLQHWGYRLSRKDFIAIK
jgi:hypothetical protein